MPVAKIVSSDPASQPVRVQRKRTKGFKLPPDVVCVTRPGKWGNPFDTAEHFQTVLNHIVERLPIEQLACGYDEYIAMREIADNLNELRGKDLACWCTLGKACHADVLIEFANR